jgi:hypothetical protein
MRKVFLLFSLLVITQIPSFAQQRFGSLTNKDKAFIIKSILLEKDLLNRDLTVDEIKDVVNISSQNISPELLPKIKGISFVLHSRKQIKEKTKTGFLYYAFSSFKIKGSKVLIDFGHYFENIEGRAFYSGGLTYEFKKVNGRWVGKEISGFGSIS